MPIPIPSIRKLLREHFSEPPFQLESNDARCEWLGNLVARLERVDRVACQFRPHYDTDTKSTQEDRSVLEVSVSPPNTGEAPSSFQLGWAADRFTLQFSDQEGGLQLHPWSWNHRNMEASPVQSEEALHAYIDAIKARQERRRAQDRKRERIETIKQHGWTAKLKKVALTQGFEFASRMRGNSIHLLIKVDPGRTLVFYVPKKEIEERIEAIAETIPTLLSAARGGLDFELSQHWAYQNADWENHRME
ncbi:MAG: hypothetical protein AAF191_11535 [Verrucomicrobiota bacterium]